MTAHTKRTKIVATIGPKTESIEVLAELIKAGLNVMRINMSHGDHAEHKARIENGRAAAASLDMMPIAILQDLSGPKIRTGVYETERITIETGGEIILTTDECVGTAKKISVNYQKLAQEVSPKSVIMLDDGKKKLVVESIRGNDIHCRVVVGGELKPRRGVNVPGAYLSIDAITEKDRADIAFGVENGIDMVALSFVRRLEDVQELRDILKSLGAPNIPIISKIETQEAIANLKAIVEVSDGVMIARGDLAIEIPAEEVPRRQKEIIRLANTYGKPVITATQMLESMIHSPVPTRAEVSDVANAIFDGTDAVMLSEESTLGAYPVEAVETLTRIALATEEQRDAHTCPIPDVLTETIAEAAKRLNPVAIVALTETGATVRGIRRFQPQCPIVALTPSKETARNLSLSRGVYAHEIHKLPTLDETLTFIPSFLTKRGYGVVGDVVLVAAGLEFGTSGATNLMVAITL